MFLPASVPVFAQSNPASAKSAPDKSAPDLTPGPTPDLVIYVKTGCPYCEEAEAFLHRAAEAHPGFRYEVRNVAESEAHYAAFRELVRERELERAGVPLMVIGERILMGYREPDTPRALAEMLGWEIDGLSRDGGVLPDLPGWLTLERLGLPAFTVLLGLLDGFNPCAMWVLMFLLSMLIHVRSRRRMFLIAGVFVLVSGLVYFLFMAAWLNLFLAFRWSAALRWTIGLLGLTAAVFHLKDFLFGIEGPSLSISGEGKTRIGQRIRAVITARNLPLALLAATTLAVLVNFYELLCTAGLPALYTQVLVHQEVTGAAFYGYLALYNLAYVLDDGIMVFAATWALSSRRVGAGAGRVLKGVSGLVLLLLSLMIIWRPEWLTFT